VELIYGYRRLFVARHLNVPLLVELREVSDIEAIVAMDIENRQRVDVSPYERARSYSRWLAAGYFNSQDELAKAFKISPAQVSRLMRLAKLPAVVVNAFANPLDLREEWGLSLGDALADECARACVIRKARSIVTLEQRPPAREVFRDLLAAAARGPKVRSKPHDRIILDDDERPLFRIREQPRAVTLLLSRERVSARCLAEIEVAVAGIMKAHGRQALRNGVECVERRPSWNLGSCGADRETTEVRLGHEAAAAAS
jgi:ParB-like chromosome segregation protein Spo0J